MNLIMETAFGSHLYGTATPASDRDWKAVRIPPASEVLLQRIKPTITGNSKVDTAAKNAAADVDRETWALHQFFRLVGEGQTVAMDASLGHASAQWRGDLEALTCYRTSFARPLFGPAISCAAASAPLCSRTKRRP